MTKAPTQIGASVRARLLKLARERKEDFQLVLTRYANERLLYRLATSPHRNNFVLKGAALFTLWTGTPHRATRDLDLLGFGNHDDDWVSKVFAEILTSAVIDDGVDFDARTLSVAPIREDQEYGGIRVLIDAQITAARIKLQVDVGFGDAVTPTPELVDFPTLLDFPAPTLRAYPRETVVAEKLDAMVQLGLANSRMKDFFDIRLLSRLFEFDGTTLAQAVAATFARRGTPLPVELPIALTQEFSADKGKETQWTAFVRKAGLSTTSGTLPEVVAELRDFLEPVIAAAREQVPWLTRWPAGGPWRSGK